MFYAAQKPVRKSALKVFLNVGTPSGVHLFDHLLWPIMYQSAD